MGTASLNNLIASARKSKKTSKKDDLDSDLDMNFDDDKSSDSSESKKARRSKRRAQKAAKPGKEDKAEGKKSKKDKKAKKSKDTAKEGKKSAKAEAKADRKSKRKDKAEGKKAKGKMNGHADLSGGNILKFLQADKAPKAGKLDLTDGTSVGNHFLVGVHRQAKSEFSTSNIGKTLAAGVKEAFGAKVSPSIFGKAVEEIHVKLLNDTAKAAKKELAGLRSAAKAGKLAKGGIEEAVANIFADE